jgi:hypothetical protein
MKITTKTIDKVKVVKQVTKQNVFILTLTEREADLLGTFIGNTSSYNFIKMFKDGGNFNLMTKKEVEIPLSDEASGLLDGLYKGLSPRIEMKKF